MVRRDNVPDNKELRESVVRMYSEKKFPIGFISIAKKISHDRVKSILQEEGVELQKTGWRMRNPDFT